MVIEVTFDTTDVYISTTVSPVYVNVSFEAPSGGGGTEWGDITGTLSEQTDLQSALDAKVPYTGATANVDLGEYELKAGQVEFDQTPTGTAGVGVMRWNDADGTLDLGLKGGNVTLQVGQEQVARVVNKSGVNLLESAYQVVKVTDAQGQRLAVDLAQANNDANSADTLGIVTENIDNNLEGFITTSGIVRNINTTGSLQGETWNDGDVLYLSPTTAGAITNVKPTAPNHLVTLGYVVYAHANNGKIFVKPNNGYELGELHDVYVPTPSNNDGIFWNSTNLRYENKTVSGALGYTPANSATTLTINGVTYDLSTSRTWSVGTITGSGAAGQVAYWTGASAQSGDDGFTWDSTNKRLTINTSGQGRTISTYHPTGAVGGNIWIGGGGVSSTFTSGSQGSLNTSVGVEAMLSNTSGIANVAIGYGALRANTSAAVTTAIGVEALLSNTTGGGNVAIGYRAGYGTGTNANTTGANNIFIGDRTVGVTATASNRTFIGNSDTVSTWLGGNLLLGSTTATGERLQVTGTTLLNGNVTFSSATGMFWDATNSRLGIGTNAPANTLEVNNGKVRFLNSGTQELDLLGQANTSRISVNNTWLFIGTLAAHPFAFGTSATERMRIFPGGNIAINSTTDSGERLQVTGTMKVTGDMSSGPSITLGGASSTVGILHFFNTNVNIRRSSSSGIEIRTGANNLGITIDSNQLIALGGTHAPTAKSDIAASTTSNASLRIRSGIAPTSPNDGDIWFDGTDIKMRIGGVTKTFTLV